MPELTDTTPLEQCRVAMGFSARSVAQMMELDPTGFIRVEKGKWSPRQDTARKIFDFYGGIVPLGLIYDPTHPSWADWLTAAKAKRLEARARKLERQTSELRHAVGR